MASSPNAGFKPLHYGGSISTQTGRLGRKPQGKSTFKSQARHETIVRLENAGFSRVQIAAMLVVSPQRLIQIMNTPEYLNARIAITHGIIIDKDSRLDLIKAQGKEIMKQMLPPALQVIANALSSPAVSLNDKKFQVSVAQDLMDREGTFAKISKSEIKLDDKFDFEKADATSRSVINAIRGVAAPGSSQHTAAAVAANAEFSNSHTLSSIDQQEALKALEDAAKSGEFDSELLVVLPPQSDSVN